MAAGSSCLSPPPALGRPGSRRQEGLPIFSSGLCSPPNAQMPAMKKTSTRGRNEMHKAKSLGLTRRESQSGGYSWKERRKHILIFQALLLLPLFFSPLPSTEFPWAESAFVYRTQDKNLFAELGDLEMDSANLFGLMPRSGWSSPDACGHCPSSYEVRKLWGSV